MKIFNRRAVLAALVAGPAAVARAQQAVSAGNAAGPAWPPAKPVRIIVAYPAGGVSDVVARLLAERLAVMWNVAVMVENRAGASGGVGMDAVAKATADGTTLGFSAISPLALNPHLGRSPFDPERDITPVASVMVSPVLLLGTQALAPQDFQGMLALARAQPHTVRWATSGSASIGHIMLEQIMASAQADIIHVPYKGGGQQMTDALGGQFEVLSTNAAPLAIQYVKEGRLTALATGAPSRLAALPNVPTLGELGLQAANLSSLFGVFAPGPTPAALVERINTDINRVLADAGFRARLLAADNLPAGGSAADFARQIATESSSNSRIIKAAGIRAD